MFLLRAVYVYSIVFKIATAAMVTSKPTSITPTESCPSVMGLGLRWPLTPKGATAVEQCLHNTEGFAHWTCGDTSPPRWDGFPNITGCASPWIIDIRQNAGWREKPEKLAKELARQTSKNALTSAVDLWSAVDLLTEIAVPGPTVFNGTDSTNVEKLAEQVFKVGSNLLAARHNASWVELGVADRAETATALMAALETTAFTLAESISSETILTSFEKNIAISAGKFQTTEIWGKVTLPPQHFNPVDSIEFTAAVLRNQGLEIGVKVVFLSYNNVSPSLDGVPAGMIINSKVITASVNDMHRPGQLKIPVTITLEHVVPANGRSSCAFWDYKTDKAMNFNEKWSTRGCTVVRSDSQKTVCQCEHLANFAVLMNAIRTR